MTQKDRLLQSGRVRFSRPLTDAEKAILTVAAELTRASWGVGDVALHEQMQSWGQRLKVAYDAITEPIREVAP